MNAQFAEIMSKVGLPAKTLHELVDELQKPSPNLETVFNMVNSVREKKAIEAAETDNRAGVFCPHCNKLFALELSAP